MPTEESAEAVPQPRAHGDSLLSFTDPDSTLPDVGPKFITTLLNIGGGGMGLRVEPSAAHALGHHKIFWLRFCLPPELKTPICATGKLVHTHVDSQQFTYAGMAFDFTFNPGHQRFVVDQICRYIAIRSRPYVISAEIGCRSRPPACWK